MTKFQDQYLAAALGLIQKGEWEAGISYYCSHEFGLDDSPSEKAFMTLIAAILLKECGITNSSKNHD